MHSDFGLEYPLCKQITTENTPIRSNNFNHLKQLPTKFPDLRSISNFQAATYESLSRKQMTP